jgi:hypothetical protein
VKDETAGASFAPQTSISIALAAGGAGLAAGWFAAAGAGGSPGAAPATGSGLAAFSGAAAGAAAGSRNTTSKRMTAATATPLRVAGLKRNPLAAVTARLENGSFVTIALT